MKRFLLMMSIAFPVCSVFADEESDRAVRKYASMFVVSTALGITSELGNRALDSGERARADRHAALSADIKKLKDNPIINGVAVPSATTAASQSVMSETSPTVVSGSSQSNATSFDHSNVGNVVRSTDGLVTQKRTELAACAPNTVFTVPFGKNSSELFFLGTNYLVCSGIKYGFMTDEEHRDWARRSKSHLYPLPHLNVGEAAVSIAGHSLGKSMLTGKPTFAFGMSYGENGFSWGH